MKKVALILVALLVGGCSIITDKDRALADRVLASGSGCVHIQGSGGAGAATPVVPVAGGYGQGSLTAAHSDKTDAKVKCGPDGASVE